MAEGGFLNSAQWPKENETQQQPELAGPFYVTEREVSTTGNERRIILIGKIGAGKSQSGNAILGCGFNKVFKAKKALKSVTSEVAYGIAKRNGKLYRVFDTPGALNPEDKKLFSTELLKCIYCTSPGFHCLTVVISVAERPNKEDLKLFKKLKEYLGPEFENHTVILFTKVEDMNELNEILVPGECPEINELIKRCQSRYLCFGDDKKGVDEKFVEEYDKMLEELITENLRKRRGFYEHPLYEKAQKFITEDAKKIRKQDSSLSEGEAFEKARERAIRGESDIDSSLKEEVAKCSCTIM